MHRLQFTCIACNSRTIRTIFKSSSPALPAIHPYRLQFACNSPASPAICLHFASIACNLPAICLHSTCIRSRPTCILPAFVAGRPIFYYIRGRPACVLLARLHSTCNVPAICLQCPCNRLPAIACNQLQLPAITCICLHSPANFVLREI